MSSITFNEHEGIGYITFDQPDSKVNVLTSEVLQQAHALLDEMPSKSLKALVFCSAKSGCFIAGADIKEIEGIVELDDGQEKAKYGQDLMNKIEDLPYPTIALINGVALGGGCELSLACTYRISTMNDKVKIGLPEVNLGFVPGFGGCYRLPKVVGLQDAFGLILTGKPVDYKKAYRIGLFDLIIHEANIADELAKFVTSIEGKGNKRRDLPKKKRGFKQFLDQNPLGRSLVFSQSQKMVMGKTKGFYPSPLAAIDLVKRIYSAPRDKALKEERLAFAKLAIGDVSKSCVNIFYLSEKYRKLIVPGTEHIKPKSIHKCAVVGAGIMGGGIAQLTSYRGVATRMKDINYDGLAQGLKASRKVYDGLVKRRRVSESEANIMHGRISTTLDYSGFESADIIIEAVVENLDVKKKIFAELSDVAHPEAILATNTSSLSVTEMAKVCKDPSKVVGFHFFNPVHRMPLIEIIKTEFTSDETLATAVDWAKKLGKTPVVVGDAAGFLVNRILLSYINEAGRLFEQGWSIEAIDRMVTKFGMPMGPFLLSDEVGLDVGVKVLHILEDAFGERFKAVEAFEKVLEKKLLGKKSGKGFYIHSAKRSVNPEAVGVVSSQGPSIPEKEALHRMIFIMLNEAAKCIDEGVVQEESDIDIGMIFGTGFPPFRGGLMAYGKSLGWQKVVDILNMLESHDQDGRFKPAQYLLNKVA